MGEFSLLAVVLRLVSIESILWVNAILKFGRWFIKWFSWILNSFDEISDGNLEGNTKGNLG